MGRKPRAIDLFSGAGGLTEGLRQAGFRVIGAVEIDSLACRTYRLNHPRVKCWQDDIRAITGSTLLKTLGLKVGELDLLAACPPCQGFSRMRTKNGNQRNRDARNDLIFDVLRIIRSVRPKSIMLENVPGLSKNNRFVEFQKALESLGYFVKWQILNVVDFGVPQSRRRLILIASNAFEPQFAPAAKSKRTVRDAIGNLTPPSKSRNRLHNYKASRSEKISQLIKKIPRNGGSRMALGSRRQLACHRRLRGFWDVYGRMSWNKPSPTITGGCLNPSKGRFLHPTANRPITLREAALLQSFPKSYRFILDEGRYAVAMLIGNALPPEFIRRHAEALRNCAAIRSRER